MDAPTGWRRYLWWLRSRKAQIALATIVVAIGQDWGWAIGETELIAILGVAVALILGIAHEDNGAKRL